MIVLSIQVKTAILSSIQLSFFFFFNDTATTEIYTLSLHDALPIYVANHTVTSTTTPSGAGSFNSGNMGPNATYTATLDRKSTRLNSSHLVISYAVFCLKKKKTPRSTATSSILLSTPSQQRCMRLIV